MNKLHLNIKIRLTESFFTSLITFMFLPYMAIYYAKFFSETLAGILIVVNVIVGLVASLYGGQLADKLGRKKIMLFSEGLRFISLVVLIFSNSPWHIWPSLTFIMMLVLNIGSGLALPAAQAMVVDVSTTDNRKLIYRLEYWSSNMALAVGVGIGGVLFSSHFFELLIIAAVGSLLSFFIVRFCIEETFFPAIQERVKLTKIFPDYKIVLRDKIFMIYVLASTLALSMEFQVMNYTGVRLSNITDHFRLWDTGNIHLSVGGVELFGLLRSENAIIVILFSLSVGILSKIIKDRWLLISGILLNAVGYYFVAIGNNAWLLLIMMVPATIGELMFYPVKQAYLADIAPVESRSVYMAVNSLVGRASTMLGGAAITIGHWFPSWLMGLLFLGTGIVAAGLFLSIMNRLEGRASQLASTPNPSLTQQH
ncbi:MDR family MFS transporter [Paenibacillus dendrobii]|nr:MFS transporter [Paenibacillus dendrobii]